MSQNSLETSLYWVDTATLRKLRLSMLRNVPPFLRQPDANNYR
jgi:hypothetical protein